MEALEDDDEDPEVFEVHPENLDAIQLWMRIQTQWFRGQFGQEIGFNYPGVKFVAKMLRFNFDEALFSRVQLMEREALNIRRAQLEREISK